MDREQAIATLSLDWKAICGMRDEAWNVASSRIPELQAVVEQFLAREESGAAPSR